MALGNLGLDKFCIFNRSFNLVPTIEQKFILLKISSCSALQNNYIKGIALYGEVHQQSYKMSK